MDKSKVVTFNFLKNQSNAKAENYQHCVIYIMCHICYLLPTLILRRNLIKHVSEKHQESYKAADVNYRKRILKCFYTLQSFPSFSLLIEAERKTKARSCFLRLRHRIHRRFIQESGFSFVPICLSSLH